MVKKIAAMMVAIALLLAPVSYFGHDNATVVSAKSYRSGVKSFNKSNTTTPFKQQKTNKSTTNSYAKKTAATKSKGGFMKGLLFGGLAGMLFGGLLANMGALGTIFGFVLNLLLIFLIISLIIKAIQLLLFKKQKQREEKVWRR